MLDTSLCESLADNRRWICEGFDRMSPRRRAVYLRHWLAIGAIDSLAGRTLLASVAPTDILNTNAKQRKKDQKSSRQVSAGSGGGGSGGESGKANSAGSGGVGTELKTLFADLGFVPVKSCGCSALADEMDRAGTEAVEASRETYVDKLRAAYSETTTFQRLKAAGLAVASGLAFSLDWSSPIESILSEAIRRARANSPSD